MLRTLCRAKIHRATVNSVDLNYVGSMTIPRKLMADLDLLEFEQVDVVNLNNGARWTTYAIVGEREDHFCLNGAAARNGQPGDLLIIMVYAQMEEAEARRHRLRVAHLDAANRVLRIEEKPAQGR